MFIFYQNMYPLNNSFKNILKNRIATYSKTINSSLGIWLNKIPTLIKRVE